MPSKEKKMQPWNCVYKPNGLCGKRLDEMSRSEVKAVRRARKMVNDSLTLAEESLMKDYIQGDYEC